MPPPDEGQARIWPVRRDVHFCEQGWALLPGETARVGAQVRSPAPPAGKASPPTDPGTAARTEHRKPALGILRAQEPGERGGMGPVTHDHVLQGVLGKPAVQKHGNEQIPQRRPEYL